MMSLKPYTSLQQITASGKYPDRRLCAPDGTPYPSSQEEAEDPGALLYLGITVVVPDGYILYLREPEPVGDDLTACCVRLLLFRATTQRNPDPCDFLVSFDTTDMNWQNLQYIEVLTGYLHDSMNPGNGLIDPWRAFSPADFRIVGYSREDLAYAGYLTNEEGFILNRSLFEGVNQNSGYEGFPIERIMEAAPIRNAVGTNFPTSGGQ